MTIKKPLLLFICALLHSVSSHADNWFYFQTAENVAIEGYDPVAYFDGSAQQGSANHSFTLDGVTYWFVSDANRQKFINKSTRYLPQFGGWDTYLASAEPRKDRIAPLRWPSDPTRFLIIENKLYLFAKDNIFDGLASWENVDAQQRLAIAERFWQSRIAYGEKYPTRPDALHPHARMENLDWLFFIGEWQGTNKSRISLEEKKYGPEQRSTWTFNYGYDGWGVQDDYKSVDFYPGWLGPAIRGFDPIEQVWNMTFFPLNVQSDFIWTIKGVFEQSGDLLAWRVGKDGRGKQTLERIRFHIINDNEFEWFSDRSYDGGHSWIERTTVSHWYRVKSS